MAGTSPVRAFSIRACAIERSASKSSPAALMFLAQRRPAALCQRRAWSAHRERSFHADPGTDLRARSHDLVADTEEVLLKRW